MLCHENGTDNQISDFMSHRCNLLCHQFLQKHFNIIEIF